MEHSNIRFYWFLGFTAIFIAVLILFSKVLKNPIRQKKVKGTFLLLFIFMLIEEIAATVFYLLIQRDTVSLLLSLGIFIGLVYANLEFFILKKRLHQNTIKNTFFVPSFIVLIIIAYVLPVVFLPFWISLTTK